MSDSPLLQYHSSNSKLPRRVMTYKTVLKDKQKKQAAEWSVDVFDPPDVTFEEDRVAWFHGFTTEKGLAIVEYDDGTVALLNAIFIKFVVPATVHQLRPRGGDDSAA